MKILIVFSVAALLLGAPGASPASAQSKAAATATVTHAGIPAGAVQIEPYSYRYKAPDGKSWLYHITPFGIMRNEETPEPADAEVRAMEGVKVTIDADTVRFERVTPLGIFHWQKKKSELTEAEQALCGRDGARGGSAQD